MCTTHIFVRTTPIFHPEMFSYFTPKLQLLGDSTQGLLGFLVGNIAISFNFLEGLCRAGHVPTFLKSFRSVLERGASACSFRSRSFFLSFRSRSVLVPFRPVPF